MISLTFRDHEVPTITVPGAKWTFLNALFGFAIRPFTTQIVDHSYLHGAVDKMITMGQRLDLDDKWELNHPRAGNDAERDEWDKLYTRLYKWTFDRPPVHPRMARLVEKIYHNVRLPPYEKFAFKRKT